MKTKIVRLNWYEVVGKGKHGAKIAERFDTEAQAKKAIIEAQRHKVGYQHWDYFIQFVTIIKMLAENGDIISSTTSTIAIDY